MEAVEAVDLAACSKGILFGRGARSIGLSFPFGVGD